MSIVAKPVTTHVDHIVSTATALFFADQPLAAGGFDRELAKVLGEEFDFTEVGTAVRPDQVEVWVARRGKWIGPGGSKAVIESAQGHELDLSVNVAGTSQQARAALAAVWRCLAGTEAPPLEDCSTILDRTTAVLKLPVDFDKAFPLAQFMRDDIVKHLASSGRELNRDPLPRFSIEMSVSISGRQVPLGVTFEPRSTAQAKQRIYYTTSPLSSDEHLAWLERLVQQILKSSGGS